VVADEAAKSMGDRAERFKYVYDLLSRFDIRWAKRRVQELEAFSAIGCRKMSFYFPTSEKQL
jgi:hypothetical protein